MALITNCAGLSSHRTISTRSPFNSLDTACTRAPRMPTHAPIGSMRRSLVLTAILARLPGSRAAPIISMVSSPISGTSMRNSSFKKSGLLRLTNNCAPRASGRTAYNKPRMRSPERKVSRGNISSRKITASALFPKSRIIFSRLAFFTTPLIISPSWS